MKKNLIWIAIAFFILSSNIVLAVPSLSRTAPSTATAGGSFQVTYTPSGTSGKYFVAWEDTITGGCTPSSYRSFIASESGAQETKQVTFTAPSGGSCVFTGFYQFANATKINFPQLTVTIGGVCTPNCACAPNTCIGSTCSNGCGGTCQGTKADCDVTVTVEECSDFIKKLAWFDFTEKECTNGYIIGGILLIVGFLVVIRLLK